MNIFVPHRAQALHRSPLNMSEEVCAHNLDSAQWERERGNIG